MQLTNIESSIIIIDNRLNSDIFICNQYNNRYDTVNYCIGKIPYTRNVLKWKYYSNIPKPPLIEMDQSNWVTAEITDRDGNNAWYIDTIVPIENNPILINTQGDTLASGFSVWPGDTVFIKSRRIFVKREWQEPDVYTSYQFKDGNEYSAGMIVFDIHSKSPVTLRNFTVVPNSDTSKTTINDGFSKYEFKLESPENMHVISIPHHSIQNALTKPVQDYVLLLRLNTGLVPGLDTIITGDFHFRNRNMLVLPHEVENIDYNKNKIDVWVKLDKLDPGIGNKAIYLAKGVPSKAFTSTEVWNSFSCVWHCNGDSVLIDANLWVDEINEQRTRFLHPLKKVKIYLFLQLFLIEKTIALYFLKNYGILIV